MKKNLFVIGLDDFNKKAIQSTETGKGLHVQGLLELEEIRNAEEISVKGSLDKARLYLDSYEGTIDALAGYWDFPVSTLLPVLNKEYGLRGPTMESILKCEHKFWSRREQQKVVAANIPNFSLVDPFAEHPLGSVEVMFPFWVKPIRSFGSYLGFRVNNEAEFHEVIQVIQENIHRIGGPFEQILGQANLPEDIAAIPSHSCIVESIIQGHQVTLEGYAQNGEVEVYGVVDSIREANGSSFSRYQYPSLLPGSVQEEMNAIVEKVIRHFEYDDGAFNVEFFYDEEEGQIWLLEVNTRISKSHCPLFELVDGGSHHEVMCAMALGTTPRMPKGMGAYSIAAKFMHRRVGDAKVENVPTQERIQEIEALLPGTLIQLKVSEGAYLSDMPHQDSYTFEIAEIFVGGHSEPELEWKYQQCIDMLGIRYQPALNSPEQENVAV